MIELADMSDTDLSDLRIACDTEIDRRRILADAATQIDGLVTVYRTAANIGDDESPWQQPESAVTAYPVGATVAHEGNVWICTSPGNIGEPGVASGWEPADPEAEA